jgi:hypothetical protein
MTRALQYQHNWSKFHIPQIALFKTQKSTELFVIRLHTRLRPNRNEAPVIDDDDDVVNFHDRTLYHGHTQEWSNIETHRMQATVPCFRKACKIKRNARKCQLETEAMEMHIESCRSI